MQNGSMDCPLLTRPNAVKSKVDGDGYGLVIPDSQNLRTQCLHELQNLLFSGHQDSEGHGKAVLVERHA